MSETVSSDALKWLDWTSDKQMKWALSYFSKKGFFGNLGAPEADPIDELKRYLERNLGSDESQLKLGKAKNAWRQQKHRKQNLGFKAYNFVLPTEVQATLKKLARMQRTNMTEALKGLIGEALEEEKHHQKELNALRDEHRKTLEKLRQGQSEAQKRHSEQKKKAEQQIKAYAKSIADRDHAAKELASEIRELLWHKVETVLQITRAALPSDERTALDELHAEELDTLKRRLKLQNGVDAFSDRPLRKINARTPGSETPPKASKK
ncbi:hypothetical protein D3C84_591420 [compost metagenome]